MSKSYANDLTQGNVNKQLLNFAMPFLFAQLLQAFYSLTDMLIVGRFMGDYGIAAVNNSSTMTVFITALVSGFALSGTVLVAQFIGAKDEENAKTTIGTLFSMFFYISVFITVIGLISTRFLLNMLNTPAEAYEEAKNYLQICFLGTIFICGYNAVSAVLRGLGDSKRPLYFVIFATVINIILDLLFVGLFQMGAAGAALATIIAQGLSFLLCVRTLYHSNFIFDFRWKSFRMEKEKIPLILKIGFPSAIQSTVVNFSYLFVISNINTYGLAASTASGIGAKIDSFAILPTIAISQAVASMAGQNLGAGKFDRAKETLFSGIRLSMAFTILIFILIRIFARNIIELFGCTPETVEIGIHYVRLVTYAYFFNAFTFIVNGLANGSGYSIFAMLNAILNLIVSRIPLILLFTKIFQMGLDGIFLAMGISQVTGVISSACFYLSGKWKKSMVSKRKNIG